MKPATFSFLYIDDEHENEVRPYIDALERAAPNVSIRTIRPTDFASDVLSASDKRVDGLLVDLRLDLVPNDQGSRVGYRAQAIAQELRTRASELSIKSLPIFLLSTKQKLATSYEHDLAGRDLFDITYEKEQLSENALRVVQELESIAAAYQTIRDAQSHSQDGAEILLAVLAPPSEVTIDTRILEWFSAGPLPTYDYARYVLAKIVLWPGPLLDEQRLASLLGVDIKASSQWGELLSKFNDAAYTGIYGSAWPRWWRDGVDAWYAQHVAPNEALQLLSASERVKSLIAATHIEGISAAKPIKEGYSDRFTTLCEGLKAPLDPIDGFLLKGGQTEPWQERRYISGHAALERVGYTKGLRIDPLERERFEALLATMEHAK